MNKLKLGPKLIGGFVVVAVIGLVVGMVGFSSIKELGAIRLPGVMGLQEMALAQQKVWVGERGLLNARMMDPVVRAAQYKYIEGAWNQADAGQKLYDPLPKTTEEAGIWKEFTPKWDEWKASHERVVQLARQNDQMIASGVAAGGSKIAELDDQTFSASMEARNKALASIDMLNKLIQINASVANASAASGKSSMMAAMTVGFLVAVGRSGPNPVYHQTDG